MSKKPVACTGRATVELPAIELRRMLDAITPYMCPDQTLPALCGVQVSVEAGRLVLAATDRYTVAVVVCETATTTGEWTGTLPLAHIKTLTRLISKRPARQPRTARLAAADTRITASVSTATTAQDDGTIDVAVTAMGGFVNWRPLVLEALAAADRAEPVLINPAYLARLSALASYSNDLHTPMRLHTTGSDKPILAIGANALALTMPVRTRGDQHADRATWISLLLAPTTATAPDEPALAAAS